MCVKKISDNILLSKCIFLSMLCILSVSVFFSSISAAEVTLLEDDFEDGNFDGWIFGEGWQIEDDDGNFVLTCTQDSYVFAGDTAWQDYSFQADVKSISEGWISLDFRCFDCTRYFVGFYPEGISLNKTSPCGNHQQLISVNETHQIGQWYTIKITGTGGNLQVFVDDVLKIEYTDPEPLESGSISLQSDGSCYFDNILVTTDQAVSASSWKETGGPTGGLGYDVRIHPGDKNIMFVTDNFAGVAKSENAGQAWYKTNTGIDIRSGVTGDAVNIFCLTIDPNSPNIVWTGTNGEAGQFGVFKSIDGGTTWQKKTGGISLGTDPNETGIVFRGFTVQGGNSDIVYAQAEIPTLIDGWEFNRVRGRVYKTTDGGESWQLIWSGENLARYLIIDHNNPDILYLSTGIFDREAYNSDCENSIYGGVGILKSLDGGITWNPVNNGLTDLYVGSLRMHPDNSQILYAAAGNNSCSGLGTDTLVSNLFRTVDGGLTWEKVLQENDVMTTVNFSPSNPDIVYAGSNGAFYRSMNGGETWDSFSNTGGIWGPEGIQAGIPIDVTIDPDDPNILYANNYGGGVFRSTDGAETWDVWSKGYTGAQVRHSYAPSGTSPVVYVISNSGFFVSRNSGADWEGIVNSDTRMLGWCSVAAHPQHPEIILHSDEHQGVIVRSTDGGIHYTEILIHPETNPNDPDQRQGFKAITFSKSDPNIVYAGLAKDRLTFETSATIGTVIYKSVDAGLSFNPVESIIDGHNVNELVVDTRNSDHVYAATTNGVYTSINGASSWAHCNNLGERHIETLVIDPDQPGLIIAGEGYQGSGVWISHDDGVTWSGPYSTGFNSPNPYMTSLVKDPNNRKTFFLSDLYSGVYRSRDNGVTWQAFPDWMMSGLTFKEVTNISINEKFMYAATQGGGVFSYTFKNNNSRSIAPIIQLLLDEE